MPIAAAATLAKRGISEVPPRDPGVANVGSESEVYLGKLSMHCLQRVWGRIHAQVAQPEAPKY